MPAVGSYPTEGAVTGTEESVWKTAPGVSQRLSTALIKDYVFSAIKDTDVTLAADSDSKFATQKAVKAYVDGLVAGLKIKSAVACATTGNITLSGEQTLDGILTSASRVLVKSQTAPAENGIYVSAAGAWSRATDMDAWAEVPNTAVWVEAGTTLEGSVWVCTSVAGGTLNTTAITWAHFGGATIVGGLLASNNLDDVASTALARDNLGLGDLATQDAYLESMIIPLGDETTAIATGLAKVTFRMPYAFDLSAVRASLVVAQTSGALVQIDVKVAGTSVFTTKPTFDNGESTTKTAVTASVLTSSPVSIADDAIVTLDISQIGDGTAKGLKVTLYGQQQ